MLTREQKSNNFQNRGQANELLLLLCFPLWGLDLRFNDGEIFKRRRTERWIENARGSSSSHAFFFFEVFLFEKSEWIAHAD